MLFLATLYSLHVVRSHSNYSCFFSKNPKLRKEIFDTRLKEIELKCLYFISEHILRCVSRKKPNWYVTEEYIKSAVNLYIRFTQKSNICRISRINNLQLQLIYTCIFLYILRTCLLFSSLNYCLLVSFFKILFISIVLEKK